MEYVPASKGIFLCIGCRYVNFVHFVLSFRQEERWLKTSFNRWAKFIFKICWFEILAIIKFQGWSNDFVQSEMQPKCTETFFGKLIHQFIWVHWTWCILIKCSIYAKPCRVNQIYDYLILFHRFCLMWTYFDFVHLLLLLFEN